MSAHRHLSRVFHSAEQIPFDDTSKIILMSDCHRGDGTWADDFLKNKNLYYAALSYYNKEKYTYIEIGDGDELWENKSLSDIVPVHSDVYAILSQFSEDGRLYLIYGNHDIVKRRNRLSHGRAYGYLRSSERNQIFSYRKLRFHEGLVLRHTVTSNKIFLVHGHQADFWNYRLWRLCRFLARHLWRPLETFGINNPTSAAKNYRRKEMVEKILMQWVMKHNQMLIAGHTHRPMFPKAGEPPYFNDGSCIHPLGITGIEIVEGQILLVKWSPKTRDDSTLYVGREVLAGPVRLNDFFIQG